MAGFDRAAIDRDGDLAFLARCVDSVQTAINVAIDANGGRARAVCGCADAARIGCDRTDGLDAADVDIAAIDRDCLDAEPGTVCIADLSDTLDADIAGGIGENGQFPAGNRGEVADRDRTIDHVDINTVIVSDNRTRIAAIDGDGAGNLGHFQRGSAGGCQSAGGVHRRAHSAGRQVKGIEPNRVQTCSDILRRVHFLVAARVYGDRECADRSQCGADGSRIDIDDDGFVLVH